jgi:hypothetical protein
MLAFCLRNCAALSAAIEALRWSALRVLDRGEWNPESESAVVSSGDDEEEEEEGGMWCYISKTRVNAHREEARSVVCAVHMRSDGPNVERHLRPVQYADAQRAARAQDPRASQGS